MSSRCASRRLPAIVGATTRRLGNGNAERTALARQATMSRVQAVLCFSLLLASNSQADSRNQAFSDFTTPLPLKPQQTLVLGIVGGWERWDNPDRITTRIARMIRDLEVPGVFVETVENHKIDLAD